MHISNDEAKAIAGLAESILKSRIASGLLHKGDTFTLPDLFGLDRFPYSPHEAGEIGKAFRKLVENRLAQKTGSDKPRTVYVVL